MSIASFEKENYNALRKFAGYGFKTNNPVNGDSNMDWNSPEEVLQLMRKANDCIRRNLPVKEEYQFDVLLRYMDTVAGVMSCFNCNEGGNILVGQLFSEISHVLEWLEDGIQHTGNKKASAQLSLQLCKLVLAMENNHFLSKLNQFQPHACKRLLKTAIFRGGTDISVFAKLNLIQQAFNLTNMVKELLDIYSGRYRFGLGFRLWVLRRYLRGVKFK